MAEVNLVGYLDTNIIDFSKNIAVINFKIDFRSLNIANTSGACQ